MLNIEISDLISEQSFCKYLKNIRKEKRITLIQLSNGIVDESNLAKIEKGKRSAGKTLSDRLMGRLGVSFEQYESKLYIGEFEDWKRQREISRIIYEICNCKNQNEIIENSILFDKAINLYEKTGNQHDVLKKEFCLVMRAEREKINLKNHDIIAQYYKKAARLIFNEKVINHLKDRLFSVQELNIIIEYVYYNHKDKFEKLALLVISYLRERRCDTYFISKIYPKIIYYCMKFSVQELDKTQLFRLLIGCNKALIILHKIKNAYYLYELLCEKEKMLECLAMNKEVKNYLWIKKELENTKKSKLKYEDACEKYKVYKYTRTALYMYKQRKIRCIGTVIKDRRCMLGMTQKELCKEICSIKTLRRIENNESQTQKEIVQMLLFRLGIPCQLHGDDIISNDTNVLEMIDEIKEFYYTGKNIEHKKILKELSQKMELSIPSNRQYLSIIELMLEHKDNCISKGEYVKKLENALSITIPSIDRILLSDEMYFSRIELICIGEIMLYKKDRQIQMQYADLLIRYYQRMESEGYLSEEIETYEVIMKHVLQVLQSIGEVNKYCKLKNRVFHELLKQKRIIEL